MMKKTPATKNKQLTLQDQVKRALSPLIEKWDTQKQLQLDVKHCQDAVLRVYAEYDKTINTLTQNLTVLQENKESFETLFEFAPMGIALVSISGRLLKVNKALSSLLQYEAKKILSYDLQSIVCDDDLEKYLETIQQLMAGGPRTSQIEQRFRRKDGSLVWVKVNISLVCDGKQIKPLYFIFHVDNIDEEKKEDALLHHIAHHDALTGLANRRLLEISFGILLNYTRRYQKQLGLLFIDVDNFKEINDEYGHLVGDNALKIITERLLSDIRETDIVGRLGGDEFILVLSELSDVKYVNSIAKKLLKHIAEPMLIGKKEISMTVSIGISLYPQDGQNFSTLLKKADDAMYEVKERGRNGMSYASHPSEGNTKKS